MTETHFLGTLPHWWYGKDERGLYCCPGCQGSREATVITDELHIHPTLFMPLNQKQVACPECLGVGGVVERRTRNRRGAIDVELLEGELGSLNLWLGQLLDAIKNVRSTFRGVDQNLFVDEDGEGLRQRRLSKHEKGALAALYAAMNESAPPK